MLDLTAICDEVAVARQPLAAGWRRPPLDVATRRRFLTTGEMVLNNRVIIVAKKFTAPDIVNVK